MIIVHWAHVKYSKLSRVEAGPKCSTINNSKSSKSSLLKLLTEEMQHNMMEANSW